MPCSDSEPKPRPLSHGPSLLPVTGLRVQTGEAIPANETQKDICWRVLEKGFLAMERICVLNNADEPLINPP